MVSVSTYQYPPGSYIEYLPEGSTHSHTVLISAGTGISLEMEEAVQLLSAAVLACSEDRHNGHGQTHGQDEADKAYFAGMRQMLTRDFDREYALRLLQKQREEKWYGVGSVGGAVPEAVLMPDIDDPKRMNLLATAPDGTPYMYRGVQRTNDWMPDPAANRAVRDAHDVSWQRRRRWSADTRLRRS